MQTNAAVAEPMVEKMKKRNETSAADRIRSYLRHPGSGVLALLTIGAAVVTFAVLIFLVAYILVKGIPYLTPSLFSLEYTSENVSLMPSLINTFIMTALSLVIAAPLGIFAAIYLVEYAKKGNRLGDICHAIGEYVHSQGYSVVREFQGHGIGREMHEDPGIPNYGKAGRGPRLEPGMTLAIEPMVIAGKPNILELDDGWGIITEDGTRAAHYENTILITENEPELLTIL